MANPNVTAIYVEEDGTTSLERGVQRITLPPSPHAKAVFDAPTNGWIIDQGQLWSDARQKRDLLLAASDWTQLADAPLTLAKKAEWTAYRQALRNLTNQPDPLAIVWPKEPAP